MATRFGKFSDLVGDREPITGEEAWEVLKKLGLLGQEFVPGATSIRKLMEGEPVEAASEFNNWIPGGKAVENFIDDKPQDWMKNLVDAAIMAKPIAKGAKKVAEVVESIPKGGKEGYVRFPIGYKDATKNRIADIVGLSTQKQRKLYSDYTKIVDSQMSGRPVPRGAAKQLYNRMDKDTKEAAEAYQAATTLRVAQRYGAQTVAKPEGFDDWTGIEREKWFFDNLPEYEPSLAQARRLEREVNTKDVGPLFKDVIQDADMRKADTDAAMERALAAERAAAEAPIEMTQVEDLSTGIVPSEGSSVSLGGTRQSYDHSRPFMDTELRQVPGIDRTGMSYGDDTDAFFDIFQAWKNNPGNEEKAINKVIKEAKRERNDRARTQVDPYYNAGVIGDSNNRLWAKINELREEGLSDAEIRSLLKDQLDAYQGDLERFKARMPSKQEAAQFILDGAKTNTLRALPSEEARALEALGITTPEYDKLEQLGNFYRVLFGK